MASTTLNRPSASANVRSDGSMGPQYGLANSMQPRSTRYGEYSSSGGRANVDDSTTPPPSLNQGLSTNPWKTNSVIWGTGNAIGSGYAMSRRETPRSQVLDGETTNARSGSSALAASSEADPWVNRSAAWNVDSTSPTNSGGKTSPPHHRGSISSATNSSILSDTQKSSPYMTRPSVSQIPSYNNNRAPMKSNLDPASGSFKYPYASFMPSGDNKENAPAQPIKGGFADQQYGLSDRRLGTGYGPSQANSRANSFASSRYTDNEQPVTSTLNDNAYSAYSHSSNNSIHAQRPSGPSRQQSFGSNTGRTFAGSHSSYESQLPTGSYLNSNSQGGNADQILNTPEVSISQYSSAGNRDMASVNPSAASRVGDHGYAGQYNPIRNHNSGFNYNSVSTNNSDMSGALALVRGQQSFGYDLDRSLQRLTLQQQQQQAFYGSQLLFGNQFQGQYSPGAWDYPYPARPLHQNYGHYQNPFGAFGVPNAPRGPARDDIGQGVRSPLLEDFRNNIKSNSKRYELKEIYGYVVEFSGDQHGSRFIQQKLETANSDEKDQIFREIEDNAVQLMTDVFGNYVIQKMFEHGNQIQKKMLAKKMEGKVNDLSLQMYGCRVVQKALEHVLADQQAAIVGELQVDVLRCVKDQNGNHVIQKAIERCPKEHVQFILDAFRGQVHTIATHPYGCRVIQRMLEYCSPQDQASILEELFACAQMLIIDQYGNYVVQHVIQHGKTEHRTALIKMATAQLHALSKHKFASNVVERAFVCGTEEERETMVRLITEPNADGSSPLHLMMKDQYGNYVIQKILIQLKGAERDRFVEHVKPHLAALRKFNAGKQLAAIEKLISVAPLGPHGTQRPMTTMSPLGLRHHTAPTLNVTFGDIRVETGMSSGLSTTPTPMLTTEQNSPQSSGMPSTTPSLIEEVRETGKGDGTPTPEVRIESV